MLEKIKSLIEANYPQAVTGEDLLASPQALFIDRAFIHPVCTLLYTHETTYFDSLSCLTGLDNGTEAGSMEVIYNLYSIPYDLHLMLKVMLERAEPVVDSVADIWRTANWHEREAFDLLGISFRNHPDLRRILLPNDWVGFPLRKDYSAQQAYHGIHVVYDRDEEVNWKDDI